MAFQNLKSDGIKYLLGKLKTVFLQIKDAVKSVNGELPDENGNIEIDEVPYAGNLTSDSTQTSRGTFVQRSSGGTASIDSGDAWLMSLRGNYTHEGYSPEVLTTNVNSTAETPIEISLDRDTFVAYVEESGTITLTYSSSDWSANPVLYGITVTGTPTEGDTIVITYVKEERGTITQSNPQAFRSTGWNLFNYTNGYARVVKYSESRGFRVEGTYTAIKFSETLEGTQTNITVTDGNFTIPSDGFVWITGGNSSNTAVYITWDDWTEEANGGVFAAYEEDEIDLSTLMASRFPYGLMAVGTVADEINLNLGTATSRVDRMEYTTANLATAKASGREYDYDEDYIYIAKAEADVYSVTLDGSYTADDHGMEIFDGTDVPVTVLVLYGNNLKNKLERDVVQVSSQSLSDSQKTQVRNNIGAASAADVTALSDQITDVASFKVGDVINLPLFNAGYANKSTEVRLYVPVAKRIPSPTDDHVKFTASITLSVLKKADGTAVSITGATVSAGRSSDYVFQITITGLSGMSQYEECYGLFDGSNRTITIVADTN